jgi:hypothetical protein
MVKLPSDTETDTGREGDLTFLDNAVQDASGTLRLRATLKNLDRHFWPGQYVNVRLVLMVKKNAVLAPLGAPQLGQQGPYVYVIKDGKAELRAVVLGQQQAIDSKTENYVVVESGLKADDQVVVNGQIALFPGSPVKIEPAKVTNPAAALPTEKKEDGEKETTSESAAPAAAKSPGNARSTTRPATAPAHSRLVPNPVPSGGDA